MTMRELDRLKCIQGLIDGQLKQHAVATRLGLTMRQVRRLVRQYEQQGPVGLICRPSSMTTIVVSANCRAIATMPTDPFARTKI
jgi:DNA-binding transcriptional regulator LsrR (DeoR family)